MSASLIELARRLVACNGWRWLPGMLDTDGCRIVESSRGLRCTDTGALGSNHYGPHIGVDEPQTSDLPDLGDPLTCLAVLLLVREAYARADMFTVAVERDGGRWEVWARGSDDGPFAWGASEVEAIVRALEAAA